MKKVQDINLMRKKVLLIVDYNVDISEEMTFCFKVDQTRKTIDYIISQNPSTIVISTHLGRPERFDDYPVTSIYTYLKKLYPMIRFKSIKNIRETPELINFSVTKSDDKANTGENYKEDENIETNIFFTDNSRYYSEYEIKSFYSNFDIIVSDAFGCSHRKQHFNGYAGFLMQREVESLSNLKDCDLLILGGAKVKDKSKLILSLKTHVFLGGLIAIEFIKFKRGILTKENVKIYESICEALGDKLILPDDFLIRKSDIVECIPVDEVDFKDEIIDVGYKTLDRLSSMMVNKKLIFWNGPFGNINDKESISTYIIPNLLANNNSKIIIGGGETTASALKFEKIESFYHVSTGGGAMLAFLSNEEMPGLECLK